MDDALLETWVQAVSESGEEYGVTLLVSGCLVTGHLTPMLRYHDWLRETGRRASLDPRHRRLPAGKIGPITEQQASRARAEWQAGARDFEQLQPPRRLCLRDAAVGQPGSTTDWARLPFLVVDLGAVAAFSPVRLGA